MKTFKISMFASCILIILACNKVTDQVAGTYIMCFKNEYSMATDTMIIQMYSQSAGTYQVERRDGFHRIRDGKILPKEFRQERWMATYDREKQVLQETSFGRQIHLKGDGLSLSFGGNYRKIK